MPACLLVCLAIYHKLLLEYRKGQKAKIGMYVDIGMVEVKIAVQRAKKGPKMSQK